MDGFGAPWQLGLATISRVYLDLEVTYFLSRSRFYPDLIYAYHSTSPKVRMYQDLDFRVYLYLIVSRHDLDLVHI